MGPVVDGLANLGHRRLGATMNGHMLAATGEVSVVEAEEIIDRRGPDSSASE